MYYSNDNLSILQAVTKSTLNNSSPTPHDPTSPTSPPSPVAPLFYPSDFENDDEYSYAVISTEEIDLATIKKQKAKTRRLNQLIKDEGPQNLKGNDDIQANGNITTTVESRAVRSYSCLSLLVVVTVVVLCFMMGTLLLLEANGTAATTMINQSRAALKTRQEQLWDWQENSGKVQWDRSKTWLHQEKAALFTLVEQSQKWILECIDDSLKCKMDLQAMVKYLDQYLFFGNAAWTMDDKTKD